MDVYGKIAEKIIKQQEAIIGPIAISQAQTIDELNVDWEKHFVSVGGDQRTVIDKLVQAYKSLFGQIAVQTSKDAVSSILAGLPPDKRPNSLK